MPADAADECLFRGPLIPKEQMPDPASLRSDADLGPQPGGECGRPGARGHDDARRRKTFSIGGDAGRATVLYDESGRRARPHGEPAPFGRQARRPGQ